MHYTITAFWNDADLIIHTVPPVKIGDQEKYPFYVGSKILDDEPFRGSRPKQ